MSLGAGRSDPAFWLPHWPALWLRDGYSEPSGLPCDLRIGPPLRAAVRAGHGQCSLNGQFPETALLMWSGNLPPTRQT